MTYELNYWFDPDQTFSAFRALSIVAARPFAAQCEQFYTVSLWH
jgi:hypothetical protein